MTNRLFIAMKLPEEIRQEIVSISKQVYSNNNLRRWEPAEKIHLTVKFLGSVEENKTPEIVAAFSDSVSGFGKIKAEYERFGFFLPNILWLSLKTDNILFKMFDTIEENFSHLGFAKEKRKFKSHITLLRMKERPEIDFVNSFRSYSLPKRQFDLTEAALIKSTLKPSGSIYTDIHKIIIA